MMCVLPPSRTSTTRLASARRRVLRSAPRTRRAAVLVETDRFQDLRQPQLELPMIPIDPYELHVNQVTQPIDFA